MAHHHRDTACGKRGHVHRGATAQRAWLRLFGRPIVQGVVFAHDLREIVENSRRARHIGGADGEGARCRTHGTTPVVRPSDGASVRKPVCLVSGKRRSSAAETNTSDMVVMTQRERQRRVHGRWR